MKEIVNSNPQLRKITYGAYAIVGLVLGSTQVGYAAAEAGQPVALTVALAVYAYVGVAFGFAAQAKVQAVPAVDAPEPVDVVDDADVDPGPDVLEEDEGVVDDHNAL